MYHLSRTSRPRAKPFGADGAHYFRPLRELLDKQAPPRPCVMN